MTLRWTSLVVGLLAGCAGNQLPSPELPWVGCFALRQGSWDSTPKPNTAGLPGSVLSLEQARSTETSHYHSGPWPDSGAVMRTAHLGPRAAVWWKQNVTAVRVTTIGLSGVTLDLAGTPDSMSGSATVFSDTLKTDSLLVYQVRRSSAALDARRITCPE